MRNEHWILCPTCGSKTRDKIREDTVLEPVDTILATRRRTRFERTTGR